MKLTKDEIIDWLYAGNYEPIKAELEGLAEWADTDFETIVAWRYGWQPEHVAELLCQKFPNKFTTKRHKAYYLQATEEIM